MKEKILVSVVTIVYNGVIELEQTFQSVFDQSYDNIEYIVIDGGSSDGTIELISKHSSKISYWVSEKDEGISDAFNKGIKYAKGDLIGLINCGDFYETNAIEKIVDAYLNSGISHQDYLVLHGNISMFNANRNKRYAPLSLRSFVYQMPIWHPTIFVTKGVYADFQYNKSYKIAMDYELFSRLYFAKSKFIYVNSLLANMNTEGLSNSNAYSGFKEVMHASRNNLKVGLFVSYFYFIYRVALNTLVTLIKRNA